MQYFHILIICPRLVMLILFLLYFNTTLCNFYFKSLLGFFLLLIKINLETLSQAFMNQEFAQCFLPSQVLIWLIVFIRHSIIYIIYLTSHSMTNLIAYWRDKLYNNPINYQIWWIDIFILKRSPYLVQLYSQYNQYDT